MRSVWILAAVVAAATLPAPAAAMAQQTVEWAAAEPLSGMVEGSELILDVVEAGVYPILVIEDPGVAPPRFSLDGVVRHEDVVGLAYFEMWTVLADGSRYFTRTLADSGQMGVMTGTSTERPVSLPFELGADGPTPARLEINLVTEGSGRFGLGPLTVVSAAVQTATTVEPPTTTTEAAPATATEATASATAADSSTTVSAGAIVDQDGRGGRGWLVAVAATVGLLAILGVLRSGRRRRADEQRRMDAIDSLRT